MAIRKANSEDTNAIISLLDQLGYPEAEKFMDRKLLQLINHPDEDLVVWEEKQPGGCTDVDTFYPPACSGRRLCQDQLFFSG